MKRRAEAEWVGDLKTGTGTLKTESGALDGQYSFSSRFEAGIGSNPEELLGAAHAGCYSMALASSLAKAGHKPTRVRTTASVQIGKDEHGVSITLIELVTRGVVPGLSEAEFKRFAEETKTGCIVSRALAAVPMTLDAALE